MTSLGDVDGPGFLEEAQHVLRDAQGRYWVGQRGFLKVFDSEGMFVATVGRLGQGPMEFDRPAAINVDPDGGVVVFDMRRRTVSVVSDSFDLLDTWLLPTVPSAVKHVRERSYVGVMSLPTPERVGFPLHVLDGEEVVRSFGLPDDFEVLDISPWHSQRVVGTREDGFVVSSLPYRYELELWNPEGVRVAVFSGRTLNDPEPRPGPWSFDNHPPNRVFDLTWSSSDGTIWVLSWERRPNWREGVVEVPGPRGERLLAPVDGNLASIYHSRIDIVSESDGALVDSVVIPHLLVMSLGDVALWAAHRSDPDGGFHMDIVRLDRHGGVK